MTDNPYRFTVKVHAITSVIYGERWAIDLLLDGRELHAWVGLLTEAEANQHADLILAALHNATKEGTSQSLPLSS